MLRLLCAVLLLVFLNWSHRIGCAAWIRDVDESIARNWRLKGNNVIKWQNKFNLHKQFFYLTYDPRNDYCEITQVSTESPDAETLTCRHKLGNDREDMKFYRLIIPNKTEKNDLIEFSYSNAKSIAKKSWYIGSINFTKCRDENLHKSNDNVAAAPTAQTNEVEMTPLPKITMANLTSEAHGRKGYCELNDFRTIVTCYQWDANGKRIFYGVKYDIPKHLKPDWFRIHNLKTSGALLLMFGECPDDICKNFIQVRLSSKGDEHGLVVHRGLNLECDEVESNMTFDIVDTSEGLCYHIVCSEDHYERDSEVKTESLLQYRRDCFFGDFYN